MNTFIKRFSVLLMAVASFVAVSCDDGGGSTTPTPTPTPTPKPVVAQPNQFAHRIGTDTTVWRSTEIICSYNTQSRNLDISAARGSRTNPNGQLLEFQFNTEVGGNGTYNFDYSPTSDNSNYLFFGSPTTASQIDGGIITVFRYNGTATISNWNATAKTFDITYSFSAQAGGTIANPTPAVAISQGTGKAIVYR